ncbi:SoxR reducing system RseC family protein [Natronospira bacteriovora]|uniref:SoxR reducing system RseC family protein n=1 Tax=Natronospira bacteriovora TaxID=3069753 RepID=A0ABU0W2P6_9GAMM|nr:SoxR reducing system RseC family protein [Natronospira sp. AB-CW4]MDQ2068291.1 SoxR reducing system RseC family protein [Natronospira sp. AB-CW4]
MILEQGRIVEAVGGHAWVEARSRSDCPRCAEGRGCGGGLIGRWLGRRLHRVRAYNPNDLPAGTWVELGLDERHLLLASILMYLPPLIGLVAVSAVAGPLLGLGEGWVILFGIGGFLLGLAPLAYLARRGTPTALATPTVIRALPGPPPGCPESGEVRA